MDLVKQSHVEEYGRQPEMIASAPGRVNLIGEHTDYNDGFVFPMAIDFSVRVAMSRRNDAQLHFYSVDYKDRKRATLPVLQYRKEDRWANYPKGIIDEFTERGLELGGMDITIHGDIPQGAGLSSSAALEVATALAVQTAFGIEMGREELARLAQHAENEFVGVKCGIMDQFISRLAKEGHAMLLDARLLTYHFVPLALKTARIFITNSRVPHGLVDSEYNRRREECRRCVELLSPRKPGTALRDYSPDDLRDSMGDIPETTRKKLPPRGRGEPARAGGRGGAAQEGPRRIRQADEPVAREPARPVRGVLPRAGLAGEAGPGDRGRLRLAPHRGGLRGVHGDADRREGHPALPGAHHAVRAHLRLPARDLPVPALRRRPGARAAGSRPCASC